LVFFGGSFDPPHLGHLILADQCLSQQKLDYILFIPTYQAPHKKENPQIDRVQHRLEMLRLALEKPPPNSRSTWGKSNDKDSLIPIILFVTSNNSIPTINCFLSSEPIRSSISPLGTKAQNSLKKHNSSL
jgi:cytidyltransferase-like protein